MSPCLSFYFPFSCHVGAARVQTKIVSPLMTEFSELDRSMMGPDNAGLWNTKQQLIFIKGLGGEPKKESKTRRESRAKESGES